MQLRQLEIFLAVARHNSFSQAAAALYLAQPTVSTHVRLLEEELHTRLFLRSTKGLSLTPEGKLFYTYASQIVNFCQRARDELKNMEEGQQNQVTVAASSVPAQYLLPAILPQVRKRHPRTCFHLLQGDSSFAVQAVLTGQAELGVVGHKENRPELQYSPLMEEKLVAATPNSAFFRSMQGRLDPDVLQNFSFILREPGSGTRRSMEEFLASQNVQPDKMQIAAELPSTEAVLRSVQNGLGLSIVSKLAADFFIDSGQILVFEFDSPLMRRQFYAVARRDVPLLPASQYMLDLLKKTNICPPSAQDNPI